MWKHLLLGAPVGVFHTANVFVLYTCVSVYCSMWKHLLLGAPVGVFYTANAFVLYVCFSVLQYLGKSTPGWSCWRVSYS